MGAMCLLRLCGSCPTGGSKSRKGRICRRSPSPRVWLLSDSTSPKRRRAAFAYVHLLRGCIRPSAPARVGRRTVSITSKRYRRLGPVRTVVVPPTPPTADCSFNLALTTVHEEFNTGDLTSLVRGDEGDCFGISSVVPILRGEDAPIGMFPALPITRVSSHFPNA